MAHVEVHNWREGLSLLQRIKYMMEGQYACDVTLKVGLGKSQKTIKAHRFILVAGSPYFESLIGPMSPANDQPITLSDTTPDVMKQVIKFLYSEEVDLTPSNVLDVKVASKKYELPQLTQACSVFLEESLKPDNVSTILTQSLTHGENTLADKCVELISQNTQKVVESDDFPTMSQTALMRVIKSDIMSGVTEVDVYKACIGWADQRCRENGREISDRNRREALGDVLFGIRFPTMTNNDFAKLTHNSSLLTFEEQASVYLSIALGQTPGYFPPATKFANNARQNRATCSKLHSRLLSLYRSRNHQPADQNEATCPAVQPIKHEADVRCLDQPPQCTDKSVRIQNPPPHLANNARQIGATCPAVQPMKYKAGFILYKKKQMKTTKQLRKGKLNSAQDF